MKGGTNLCNFCVVSTLKTYLIFISGCGPFCASLLTDRHLKVLK